MLVEPLRQLGLTEGEIKVYLALVKLGTTTSGPIVEKSGISVSKVYGILDRLTKKGLVSHILEKKTKHFKAADPQRLMAYLKEKQEILSQQETALQSMVNELKAAEGSAVTEETAQVYEGLRGIQTARERTLNIMKRGDQMWIIGIAQTAYDNLAPYFLHYHEQRYKKGIKCNFLYNENAKDPFGKTASGYLLSEVKYMPKGLVTHAWIEIYADTVTIGNNKGKSFSVVIQDQNVADSFRIYAEQLWKISKS